VTLDVGLALTRIGRYLARIGASPDDLAVTRISRRRDPFGVLVATVISLRTKDEVTDVAAPRLLRAAPTPARLAKLEHRRIERLIYPAGFYRTKARVLRRLGRTLVREHRGRVPDTIEGLTALHGVGRKTANLVVTLGHGKPGICVDIHVHRICNRLGCVRTRSPDETEQALRRKLPRRWWIPINDLLVTFGRTTCTPVSPWCSRCPVTDVCRRVGVGRTR
jgi:endonuclease-3